MGVFRSSVDAPYDKVQATDTSGKTTTWTRAEFEKLPLLDRVRLLAGGELRFFRESKEVPAREALAGV
jgi:hypothetical protein